jgi:hypothetical protein
VEIINFIKEYWVIISFFVGELGVLYVFAKSILEGTKCSLRNDILEIWDRCNESKEITHYQLQSIQYSYELYKKLKGNSFIDEIMTRVKEFKIID